MKTAVVRAPFFRLHPLRRAVINKFRLNVDIAGLYLLKFSFLLGGVVHGWIGALLVAYNGAAFVTVLSLDPSRLPEAATTRIHQRRAWLLLVAMTPLIAMMLGLLSWSDMLSLNWPITLPPIGLLITFYTDELLFRNIIQPALRRIGFSRWGAIISQAALFALPFAVSGRAVGYVTTMAALGLVNGCIIYRHRSLWPAFTLATVVRTLCIGN